MNAEQDQNQNRNLQNEGNLKSGKKNNKFKCDLCTKTFITVSQLIIHKRIHTGERPFQCDICSSSFNQLSNLRSHMGRHTGKRPFKCNICSYTFAKKDGLQTHSRTHTGERPFKCDICPNEYITKSRLDVHKSSHTGERPFKCNICPNAYVTKSSLDAHKRSHTGERPFKCNICPASFAQQAGLRRHTRIHTGEKPFNCEKCPSAFNDPSSLRRHRKTHTPVNASNATDQSQSVTGDNNESSVGVIHSNITLPINQQPIQNDQNLPGPSSKPTEDANTLKMPFRVQNQIETNTIQQNSNINIQNNSVESDDQPQTILDHYELFSSSELEISSEPSISNTVVEQNPTNSLDAQIVNVDRNDGLQTDEIPHSFSLQNTYPYNYNIDGINQYEIDSFIKFCLTNLMHEETEIYFLEQAETVNTNSECLQPHIDNQQHSLEQNNLTTADENIFPTDTNVIMVGQQDPMMPFENEPIQSDIPHQPIVDFQAANVYESQQIPSLNEPEDEY